MIHVHAHGAARHARHARHVLGQFKVAQDRGGHAIPARDQNVVQIDVAVAYPLLVRARHGTQQPTQQALAPGCGKRARPFNPSNIYIMRYIRLVHTPHNVITHTQLVLAA